MHTWFILASGPSMCREDADAVRGRGTVVAINCTIELAPWADVLYAGDPSWWGVYGSRVAGFTGRRVGLDLPHQAEGIERLRFQMKTGLGLSRINHGNNSGYQAINFAFLQGARRMVLLGYDMQHTGGRHHWHPDHTGTWRGNPMGNFAAGMPELVRPKFDALASDLEAQGVEVINASRETALRCFRRMPLADALGHN